MTQQPKKPQTKLAPKPPGKAASIVEYLPLVERVARVEYRRIPSHMVELDELVSIGALAIQALIKNKSQSQLDGMNTSYLATATRWAIRNELRSRYKWYTLRHTTTVEEGEEGAAAGGGEKGKAGSASPETVREAIYETILSIDSIVEGSEGDSPHEIISDGKATPEEHLEIAELGRAIKAAIDSLPEKERKIMEYRFYKNMQVKDIAAMMNLSSSRITRIVQASLDMVREYLRENEQITDYPSRGSS